MFIVFNLSTEYRGKRSLKHDEWHAHEPAYSWLHHARRLVFPDDTDSQSNISKWRTLSWKLFQPGNWEPRAEEVRLESETSSASTVVVTCARAQEENTSWLVWVFHPGNMSPAAGSSYFTRWMKVTWEILNFLNKSTEILHQLDFLLG